jgi:3-oxoadipate enol-lactonase
MQPSHRNATPNGWQTHPRGRARSLEVAAARMVRWSEAGSSDVTLVCLPGALCPPEIFEDAVARSGLAAVGVALMEGAGPHDPESVARRVRSQIAGLGPVIFVGHSLGSVIAALMALPAVDAPDLQVRGLLLGNRGANTRGHGDIDRIIAQLTSEWGPPLRNDMVRRCLGGPVAPALEQRMRAYPAELSSAVAVESRTGQKSLDLLPRLPALAGVPTAVVHGLRDPARTLEHARQFVDHNPGATLHVFDTGHTTCAEDPDGFAAVLRALAERAAPQA